MIERRHRKLKKLLRINVSVDRSQWDQYVNIAVMAHNTTYKTSLKCPPTEIVHGKTQHNAIDLKFANRIHTTSQPEDISEMLHQDNQNYKEKVHNIVCRVPQVQSVL